MTEVNTQTFHHHVLGSPDQIPSAHVPTVFPVPQQDKNMLVPSKDPVELAKMACAMLGLPPNDYMKVAGIIISGYELGIPPMTAARSIYIIQGRPAISSEMQRALVMASPKCKYFIVHPAQTANGDMIVTAEAERSNGAKKSVTAKKSQFQFMFASDSKSRVRWINYPERMLTAAASRWLVRDLFPDVISGFGDLEEDDSERDHTPINITPVTADVRRLQPPVQDERSEPSEPAQAQSVTSETLSKAKKRGKPKPPPVSDVSANTGGRPEPTGSDTAPVGRSADTVRGQSETESVAQEKDASILKALSEES